MAASSSNAPSHLGGTGRKTRELLSSPYHRPHSKSKEPSGLSRLWKWISSFSTSDNFQETRLHSRDEQHVSENTTHSIYMPSLAATKLADRGHQMQSVHRPSRQASPNLVSLPASPSPSKLKPLVPRSNVVESASIADYRDGITSTLEWFRNKVHRGEDISADEAADILPLLERAREANIERPFGTMRTGIDQSRFAFSVLRNPSAGSPRARKDRPRTLRTNPNGEPFSRGSGRPIRHHSPVKQTSLSPEKNHHKGSLEAKAFSTPSSILASFSQDRSFLNSFQAARKSHPAVTIEDLGDDDDEPLPANSITRTPFELPKFGSDTKLTSTSRLAEDSRSKYGSFSAHPKLSPFRQNSQFERPTDSQHGAMDESQNKVQVATPIARGIMSDIINEASSVPSSPSKPQFNVTNPYQSSAIPARKIQVPAPRLPELTKSKESAAEKLWPPPPIKSSGNPFLDYLDVSAPEDIKSEDHRKRTEPFAQRTALPAQSWQHHAVESGLRPTEKAVEVLEDDIAGARKDTTSTSGPTEELLGPKIRQGSLGNAKSAFALPNTSAPKMAKPVNKTPFFPKEPSPLRQSFAPSPPSPVFVKPSSADINNVSPQVNVQMPTAEKLLPKPQSQSTAFSHPQGQKRRRLTREEVLAVPVDKLPVYFLDVQFPVVHHDPKKLAAVMAVPEDQLPKFNFDADATEKPSPFPSAAPKPFATESSKKSGSFDWGAAGLRKPILKEGEWRCSGCDLMNGKDLTKCQVCTLDRH